MLQFCKSSEIEYLPFRFWVGFWIFIITALCVALEGSVLVRFFTRFTEDIFGFLISIIFIYEVFNKLFQVSLKTKSIHVAGICILPFWRHLEYYKYSLETSRAIEET